MSLMLKLAIFIRDLTQEGIDLTAIARCRRRLIVVLIARKEAGRVTLWTRHWTDFTDRLPRIAEAVRSLLVDSALVVANRSSSIPMDTATLRRCERRMAPGERPSSPSIFSAWRAKTSASSRSKRGAPSLRL